MTPMFVEFGKLLFLVSIAPLIIYSMKFYALGFASIFFRKGREDMFKPLTGRNLPRVSVHIPVYNDPVVVDCVKKCLEFDYPKGKYEIIVADDSSDETSGLLDKLHKEGGGFRIIRRKSRAGFKAGALNGCLKASKGGIVVVFDSDYSPEKDFLRRVVKPFADKEVAFVQTRWDYKNPSTNRISKLAMISYNAFHQCSMPVKDRIGTAIFCGTGGAIRKDVLQSIGGWNEKSIGEDIDLTVRMLCKGYKQVYLPGVRVKGEVPETLKSFVKQQQRWAYATTKALKDYFGSILFSKELSKMQKFDLMLIMTGFLTFPFIMGVTLSTLLTMLPWFGPGVVGEFFSFNGFVDSMSKALGSFFSLEGVILLGLSCGYMFECAVALIMQRKYRDIATIPYIFVVGLVLEVTNTIAVFKALLGKKYSFYKTPKTSYRGVIVK